MKIYLLNAGVHYEGRSTVKAFSDRLVAEGYCEKLTAWLLSKPACPDGAGYDDYFKLEDAHKATCPLIEASEEGFCDYFDVEECELDEATYE